MNQVVYKNCFTSTLKILFYVVFLVNKLGVNLNLDFSMKWVKFKHNNASMDKRLRMIYKNIHFKKKKFKVTMGEWRFEYLTFSLEILWQLLCWV